MLKTGLISDTSYANVQISSRDFTILSINLKWIRKLAMKRAPRDTLPRNSAYLRVGGRCETSRMTSSSGFRLDEPRKIRRTRAAARARPISPVWYKAVFNGRGKHLRLTLLSTVHCLAFVKIDTDVILSPDFIFLRWKILPLYLVSFCFSRITFAQKHKVQESLNYA